MLKELASETTNITYALIVLVIFAAFFAGVLLWVFRKSARVKYDSISKLPLSPDEADVVKQHEYDGIREYDNQLPRWWLGTFIITVVFGLGYWLYYHTTQKGLSIAQEYQADAKAIAAIKPVGTDATLSNHFFDERAEKAESIQTGSQIFLQNCMACHGDHAQGIIGPNLTDDYWIHGGKPLEILQTIENGVVAKGMLAWKGVLKPEQIYDVIAYILSIRGSNPANAKAPEGNLVKRDDDDEGED